MSERNQNNDEYIEPTGASGDVAVIGESASKTQVSLQTLQGIYNELTGKSEEVGKSYSKPLQIGFHDIEQLDHKITQAGEQYNIVSMNCSVTVYYVDDTRDQFSSFDRFRLHNAGSVSPVESVLVKYNFLVLLPKTKQPQSYRVSVRLASRVAIAKRMEGEFYGAPPHIFRLMGNRTAVVEIQYVDYMVARNFLNIVDDWIKGVPAAVESKGLRWLQARSHFIPRIFRFLMAVFVALVVMAMLSTFITSDTVDLLAFGRFVGYALLGTYTAYTLAGWGGILVESAIDQWSEVAYISLTKGDEKEIKNARKKNRFAVAKGVLGFLWAFGVSVASKVLALHLVK